MEFSTNVSKFCYCDTGPSARQYRLTKSYTFRDSLRRRTYIEATILFIYSCKNHVNSSQTECLHLLGEAGHAERGVGGDAAADPPLGPEAGLGTDLHNRAAPDLGHLSLELLLLGGAELVHREEDGGNGEDGDSEGDCIEGSLQVPGEGEAAGVEVSGYTRACHVSKVEQEADCNKGHLSSPSARTIGGLSADLSHDQVGSVIKAGSDKTGNDGAVTVLLHPHNQNIIDICWVRYDRSRTFWSMALIMLASNKVEVRKNIRYG